MSAHISAIKIAARIRAQSHKHILAAVHTALIDWAADRGWLFTTLLFDVEPWHKSKWFKRVRPAFWVRIKFIQESLLAIIRLKINSPKKQQYEKITDINMLNVDCVTGPLSNDMLTDQNELTFQINVPDSRHQRALSEVAFDWVEHRTERCRTISLGHYRTTPTSYHRLS